MTTLGITRFAPKPDGTRNCMVHGWQDGTTILVSGERSEQVARDLVERLSPRRPGARLLGPGCLRFDAHGKLWLLGKRERGWAAFGVCVRDWDTAFRRFDMRITGHGTDETGEFWTAEPA